MIGKQESKNSLNNQAGEIAIVLKRVYDDAVAFNEFLLRTSDADLTAMGFTQPEIDTLKSAFADLAYQKYQAFDSSQHVKKLYGTGI